MREREEKERKRQISRGRERKEVFNDLSKHSYISDSPLGPSTATLLVLSGRHDLEL